MGLDFGLAYNDVTVQPAARTLPRGRELSKAFYCEKKVSDFQYCLLFSCTHGFHSKPYIYIYSFSFRYSCVSRIRVQQFQNIILNKSSNQQKLHAYIYIYIYIYIYTLRKTMKPVTLDYKFISILLRIFEISKNTKKHTSIYIYIYIEREREIDRDR